jgi:hypothetical protein
MLSVTSVADPQYDAAPALLKAANLSISLCLCVSLVKTLYLPFGTTKFTRTAFTPA